MNQPGPDGKPLSPDDQKKKEDEQRTRLEGIVADIKAGKITFEDAAKKYSDDKASGAEGGALPWFGRTGMMVPEFETVAFSLTNNQVSDIVTTMYGFHIIKMLDKTPAKKFALNDTLPQLNKTVSDICKSEVEAAKIKEGAADYIKGLRKELDVQITDPALKQLDETVRAQADAAATTGLSSPAASAGAK